MMYCTLFSLVTQIIVSVSLSPQSFFSFFLVTPIIFLIFPCHVGLGSLCPCHPNDCSSSLCHIDPCYLYCILSFWTFRTPLSPSIFPFPESFLKCDRSIRVQEQSIRGGVRSEVNILSTLGELVYLTPLHLS